MNLVLVYLFTSIYLGPLAYFVIIPLLEKGRWEILSIAGSWLLAVALAWGTVHILGESPVKIILFAMAALALFAVSVYITQPKYQACFQGDESMCIEVERLTEEEANAYYDGRKPVNDNQRNYVDQMAEE